MKHTTILLISLALFAAACAPKSGQKATPPLPPSPPVPKVSYTTDISPILLGKCAPCHFPSQQGKKEPLDTYAAAKNQINEMIARAELPQEDIKFMPYKLKKPALTPEEITALKNWARGGFGA
jgi:hypothetical protein